MTLPSPSSDLLPHAAAGAAEVPLPPPEGTVAGTGPASSATPAISAIPPSATTLSLPGRLELAVVVPTFNEAANLSALLAQLDQALVGVRWEVIFVDDDSPDGTAAHLHALAAADTRVRCLRRVGRRGLSSACVEGLLATGADCMAVMDADGQHDASLLPRMLDVLRQEPVDLVVGTRYMPGGGVGEWDQTRQRLSGLATRLGQGVLGLQLADPMSGFFMLRRPAFEASVYRLSGIGFKILADLMASSPSPLRVKELPYRFGIRQAGQSKLDKRVAWDYLMLLADKTLGRWVPARLVSFSIIGAVGVGVHLIVLQLTSSWLQADFIVAQSLAVAVAMVCNFHLNNALTYRDQQLIGWRRLSGLLKFMAACGLGAVANVGVATYLHVGWGTWLLPGLAGVLVGTVWNYGATAHLVWQRQGHG